MNNPTRSAFAAAVLCLSAGAAQALSMTVYTDPTSFAAAVAGLPGGMVSTDFSSPTGLNDGTAYLPLVDLNTYSQVEDGPGPVLISENVFVSVDGALTDAGSPATASNPFGVGAVGGIVGAGTRALSWTFLSAANAPLIVLSNGPEFAFSLSPVASGFVGVVTDAPILAFLFLNGRFPDTGTPDRYFIDNLSVQVVPEPAAYAMFLAGLAGVIGAAARRRA